MCFIFSHMHDENENEEQTVNEGATLQDENVPNETMGEILRTFLADF